MLFTLPPRCRRILKPRKKIGTYEWGRRFGYLPKDTNQTGGKYDPDHMTPWARPVMDDLDDKHVELVAFQAPRQMAKTTIGLIWIGHTAEYDQAPMMVLHKDRDHVAVNFAKERLHPFVNECPTLKRIKHDTREMWTYTEMHWLTGMWLYQEGSNVVMNVSSRSVAKVWVEEINKQRHMLGDHSSPLSEVEKCTVTFDRPCIYVSSTPTNEFGQISRVGGYCQAEYLWHTRCPHCDELFEYLNDRDHFKFTRDEDDPMVVVDAWYECQHCGKRINESQKRAMEMAGEMVCLRKPKTRKPRSAYYRVTGFHCLAPGNTWVHIAEAILKANAGMQGHPIDVEPTRDLYNNRLGMEWEEVQVSHEHNLILARAEGYERGVVPADCETVLAGVDRHGSDFHFVVYGFRAGMGMHLVDHGIISKDWDTLKVRLLDRVYLGEDGKEKRIHRLGMDCAYEQEDVYDLCRRTRGRVVPVRGSERKIGPRPRPQKIDPKLGNSEANEWWESPGDTLKTELAEMLEIALGDQGALEFHTGIEDDFARQMVGQERIQDFNPRTKRTEIVWRDKKGHLVHFWDATVIARSLAYAKSVDVIVNRPRKPPPTESPPAPPPLRPPRQQESAWLSGGKGWL